MLGATIRWRKLLHVLKSSVCVRTLSYTCVRYRWGYAHSKALDDLRWRFDGTHARFVMSIWVSPVVCWVEGVVGWTGVGHERPHTFSQHRIIEQLMMPILSRMSTHLASNTASVSATNLQGQPSATNLQGHLYLPQIYKGILPQIHTSGFKRTVHKSTRASVSATTHSLAWRNCATHSSASALQGHLNLLCTGFNLTCGRVDLTQTNATCTGQRRLEWYLLLSFAWKYAGLDEDLHCDSAGVLKVYAFVKLFSFLNTWVFIWSGRPR